MPDKDPELQAARDFITHLTRGDLMSAYLLSSVSAITDDDDLEPEDKTRQVNTLLQRLQYPTTWSNAFDRFEATANEELGFWAGRYTLVDVAGTLHHLSITSDGATLVMLEGNAASTRFSASKLELVGDGISATLVFALPEVNELASSLTRSQPRCNGTIKVRRDDEEVLLDVRGKRGCHTADGIARELDGDPAAFWAGVYRVVHTESQKLVGMLRVVANGDALEMTLDGKKIEYTKSFSDNRWAGTWNGARIGGVFSVVLEGTRRLFGAIEIDGVGSAITGYLTGALSIAKPSVRALRADPHALPSDATKVTIETSPVPTKQPHHWIGTKPELDRDGKPTGNDIDVYVDLYELEAEKVLPIAVERNPYAVRLDVNLSSYPELVAAKDCDATIVGIDDNGYTKNFIKLRRTQDGVLWLDTDGGETESASWVQFYLQLSKTSGAATTMFRVKCTVEITSRTPIVVDFTDVGPIILNKPASGRVTANGGQPPFLWKAVAGTGTGLSTGVIDVVDTIKFDTTTQQFTGTTTNRDLLLNTYPVKVVAYAASPVIMLPGSGVVNVRVESEYMAGDITGMSVGIAGVLVGLGGALYALGKYLWQNHKDGKTLDEVSDATKTVFDGTLPLDADAISSAMVDAFATAGGDIAGQQAAEAAARSKQGEIATKRQAAETASKTARGAFERDKDKLSDEAKAKILEDIQRLDDRVTELKLAEYTARHMERQAHDMRVDHTTARKDFETHVKA